MISPQVKNIGVSPAGIETELLAALYSTEYQELAKGVRVGIKPVHVSGRGSIDQISTLLQTLEHRYTLRRLTSSISLDMEEAFESVGRAMLWRFLSLKDGLE